MHLLPISCEFLNEYPEISLRLLLTDRVLNPQEEKIDVAIRIGHLPDSSLIATRIGSVRFVACASPDYLEAHGVATEPGDLSEHNCILIKDGGGARPWKFSKAGNDVPASISSRLTVSTSEAAVEAAIAGAGIARVMHYKMEAARLAGKLIVILKDFELEALPVHIVHAEWRPVPLKLRAYLDWVTPRLKVRLP
jgi:DNA-binding transcriptional LysR family regulator